MIPNHLPSPPVSLKAVAATSNGKGIIDRVDLFYRQLPSSFRKTFLQRLWTTEERGIKVNIYAKYICNNPIKSFKIGALNAMLHCEDKSKIFLAASSGNHAQGVAASCALLKRKGIIFMPEGTSQSKIEGTANLGGEWVEIRLRGRHYQEVQDAVNQLLESNPTQYEVIHPYDDPLVMEGQAIHAHELFEEDFPKSRVDLVCVPGGGGGLAAGCLQYLSERSPRTQMLICEAVGSDCVHQAVVKGEIFRLPQIDTYCGGAAVAEVGENTFKVIDEAYGEGRCDFAQVSNGDTSIVVRDLYKTQKMVSETSGVLGLAAIFRNPKGVEMIRNLCDKVKKNGRREINVVAFITGKNMTSAELALIEKEAEAVEGVRRYYELELHKHEPGQLYRLACVAGRNQIDIQKFHFDTANSFSSEGDHPIVDIECKATSAVDVLAFEQDIAELGYRFNDETAYHYSRVSQNLKPSEDNFHKSELRPPLSLSPRHVDVYEVMLAQRPGSLLRFCEDVANPAGANVEIFHFEQLPESTIAPAQIGVSGSKKSLERFRKAAEKRYKIQRVHLHY